MSATLSPSTHQAYGVALACRSFGIPRSTYYDWRKRQESDIKPARRGPRPEVSDQIWPRPFATSMPSWKLITVSEARATGRPTRAYMPVGCASPGTESYVSCARMRCSARRELAGRVAHVSMTAESPPIALMSCGAQMRPKP